MAEVEEVGAFCETPAYGDWVMPMVQVALHVATITVAWYFRFKDSLNREFIPVNLDGWVTIFECNTYSLYGVIAYNILYLPVIIVLEK